MARIVKDKDMRALRETPSFRDSLKDNSAVLKDYAVSAEVKMQWDLNEDSKRERIFKLVINGEEAYLDAEEFLGYLRLV